ncbi:MAG: hypothetical protein ACKODK_00775 [Opitutaceae bacterium]
MAPNEPIGFMTNSIRSVVSGGIVDGVRRRVSNCLLAACAVVLATLNPFLVCAGTGAAINEALVTQTLNVRLASGLPGANAPFGNDVTADGTAAKPYATIKAALARAATIKNGGNGVKVIVAPGTSLVKRRGPT